IRHVLFGQDARDDALVAVAAGHLVADRQLALHRDVHLDQLDHAGRQFVAAADLLLALLEFALDHLDALIGAVAQLAQIALDRRIVAVDLRADERGVGHRLHDLVGQDGPLLHETLAAVLVEHIRTRRLPAQNLLHALLDLVVQDADFVLEVPLHRLEVFGLALLGAVVLLDALAREDLDADDDAFDAGGADERRVTDVAGLLTEDRAQQLLFRRQLGLALRRDLADQNRPRLDVGADPDDAAVVEIAQHPFRD